MPTTINGVGTHYYGKKNRSVRQAHCHSCERFGPLESYDTRLWFVIIFLPIIPLGRKRITDSCPSCRRHMVADSRTYEQAKQLQTTRALEQYHREGTPEAALGAHGLLLAFHDRDRAEVVRTQALDRFPDDATLRVALANQLRQASLFDETVRLYREALDIDPELPEARAGVALHTMTQGDLDEARRLLDFMEEPGAGRHHALGPLYTLAGKFAAADRPHEALELCRVLIREAPHLSQQPEFRTLVRKTERALMVPESVLPGRQHSIRGLFFKEGSPYSQNVRNAAIVTLVLVFGAGAMALSNEYIRRNRTIRIVNALDPVQVQVDDGPPATIRGLGTVAVAEGNHRLRVSGPIQETHDVAIEAGSYWERWSHSPVWVLNPGGAAVLEQITISYAVNPPPPQQHLLVGRPFLTLPHIDYPFTQPPNSLKIKGKNAVVTKEALRWVQGQDQATFLRMIGSNRGAALDFAEQRLRRKPDDTPLFDAYTKQIEPAERQRAEAFLQTGLARRPISIPWHRAAQTFGTKDDRAALVASYDAALGSEPTNAPLLYLRGRLETDPVRRDDAYRRSIAADPRLSWPVLAVGSTALAEGRWEVALAELRQAEELGAEQDGTSVMIHTARMALGQAEELIKEYRSKLDRTPTDIRTLTYLLDALAAAEHPEEIEAARAGCENRLVPALRNAVGPMLGAIAGYLAADPGAIDQFIAARLPSVEGTVRVHYLLAAGRATAAAAVPQIGESDDPWLIAAIALGLALDGKLDEAKAWQEKAAERIVARPDNDQHTAAILRSATPPPLDAIRSVLILPGEKALLLALMAQSFPARRDEYHREAARFNVRRNPPYLLIRRATAVGGAAQP